MLNNNHPRSAVIIPKMYNASVEALYRELTYEFFSPDRSKMREAKLILAFKENPYIEADINLEIVPFIESCFVPVIYALHIDEQRNEWMRLLFVIFSGSNVETSAFLVETTDEEKLKEKLLKWKSELDFLESHHIIPFHFTKESMEPTNSGEIFREIFGIQPAILRLSASELAETGLIYCSSKTKVKRNPGPVYAIVGYKKF
ncbi:hypothetical protein X798_06836 [Onchocerca flexuosa]|uniref:Uncharacterized protein n=1 Tax=Onchocerca flexuosa TaxID=387005 RepID=A0A238BLA6_9BILA|nr:hypothetical protein X798_06836 [Onchocerca flexuosa]